ncbi:hypothetical protein TNCV_4615951 [Trichonephila clavipes]|nr:hypothetical protein TNCV_4615951 [Trichonephila clavipes]
MSSSPTRTSKLPHKGRASSNVDDSVKLLKRWLKNFSLPLYEKIPGDGKCDDKFKLWVVPLKGAGEGVDISEMIPLHLFLV